MRALVVRQLGEPPELAEAPDPVAADGESLIAVDCAPLNPIDIAIAGGRSFAGNPAPPYVPGIEAVGRIVSSSVFSEGDLVFTCVDGLGLSRSGACAEMAVARDRAVVKLPDGIDPGKAASLGTAGLAAWIPLTQVARVQPDDIVLILGASGTVGRLAVQIAKLSGARRVVAAGRSQEGLRAAEEAGADAIVELGRAEDLAEQFRASCGGSGPSLIFDPLWGDPLVAALKVAPLHARVVQLGQSAGATAEVPSALVRGKNLSIFGYTNLNMPIDVIADSYRDLLASFQQGNIDLDVITVPLDEAVDAWKRQQQGPRAKLVICP